MDNNPSITAQGWQRFATILESPNFHLTELYISHNNIDAEAVAAFANALTRNHMMNTLDLDNNHSITAEGWEALLKLLCNTSSVNATFLSNHTLDYLGDEVNDHEMLGPLLGLNGRDDKKEVAMIKILQCHEDFDMQPFLSGSLRSYLLC